MAGGHTTSSRSASVAKSVDSVNQDGKIVSDAKSFDSVNEAEPLPTTKYDNINQDEPNPTSPSKELPGQSEPPRKQPIVWIFFIACIVSSPFLFGFDLIVVGTMQPKILEQLGEVDKLSWISISYALAAISTTLLWGRLYTVMNIKWAFLIAVIFFALGAVVSGAAPNMNALIVGRALSGLGAIGTYMGAMTTLTVVTTIKERPLYFSFITFAYGAGTLVAPFIGGAFADSTATWRWGFYINACVCALFTPGYIFLFPSKNYLPKSVGTLERLRKLDPFGNILWAGATASLLMAISFGGALYAWNSGQVIGLFICTGILWIAFIAQQWKVWGTTTETRIFPAAFLKSLEVSLLFIQTATSTAVAVVPAFLIPIYFQFVRGSTAISAGVHVVPLVLLRSVFVLANGFLMKKYGYVLPWYVAGATLCVAGSAPFLTTSTTTSSASFYGYTVLLGVGVGMYNQASFSVAQARTSPKLAPQATVFIMVGQVVGLGVCLAIANSIFVNQATVLISKVLPGVSVMTVQRAILGGLAPELFENVSEIQKEQIFEAVVSALNSAWASVVAAAAVSLLLTLGLKRDRAFR